jgi:hypothetical protein
MTRSWKISEASDLHFLFAIQPHYNSKTCMSMLCAGFTPCGMPVTSSSRGAAGGCC